MAWWWPQQQKDLPAFLTKRCWLELPLKGAPSRRSSLKTCHRRVFLTLGPSRVQILPRSNEKKSGIAEAISDYFLQGQKDLVSAPLRSARNLRATGTHSPLGTRFWSGCGRTQAREGKGRCCPFSSARRKRAVLVWCCGKNLPSSNSPLPNLPRLGIIVQKNILERREETLCPWT